MSEEQRQPSEAQMPQAQQRRIQLRDMGVMTHFANFFTVTGGLDAVLLSFGNQFGPDVVQVETKVALSPRNAKRLALSLGQLIRAYEQQHGEIDISPPAPPPPPSEQTG